MYINDAPPCTISGSSSENNLYANPEDEVGKMEAQGHDLELLEPGDIREEVHYARDYRHDAYDVYDEREGFMVPTHERALSLFNPQFLPNFNDLVTYARDEARSERRFFTARFRDEEFARATILRASSNSALPANQEFFFARS